MSIRFVNVMKGLLVLFLTVVSQGAIAECQLPTDANIRWIVPTKPGGGYDAWSRLLQPFMEEALEASIRIENRVGAGGLIGAMAIRDASPDGTTMGIINAPGLLAAGLVADSPAPDPETDFTIIGRVATTHVVMFTGQNSGIGDIDELLRVSAKRPILVGVHDAGSSIFIALPIAAGLLGLDYELVTGYIGNTARTMAALRGEVDVVFNNFDSARRYVEAGELIPLLQITDPSSRKMNEVSRTLLADVPVLADEKGVASRLSESAGKTARESERQARALDSIFSAGRLIVAPRGLPASMRECLQLSLAATLDNPELRKAAVRAGLGVDYRRPEVVYSNLSLANSQLVAFKDEITRTIERTRD